MSAEEFSPRYQRVQGTITAQNEEFMSLLEKCQDSALSRLGQTPSRSEKDLGPLEDLQLTQCVDYIENACSNFFDKVG